MLSHREMYSGQYHHPLVGKRVEFRDQVTGTTYTSGTVERVVESRFGQLAILTGVPGTAYTIADAHVIEKPEYDGPEILYLSDGEQSALMDLGTLAQNLREAFPPGETPSGDMSGFATVDILLRDIANALDMSGFWHGDLSVCNVAIIRADIVRKLLNVDEIHAVVEEGIRNYTLHGGGMDINRARRAITGKTQ